MKKYSNPNGANEQKNIKSSGEDSINQGQGPEFQTEEKNFRRRNKGMTPLGDTEGQKNKVTRTEDHESVGGE